MAVALESVSLTLAQPAHRVIIKFSTSSSNNSQLPKDHKARGCKRKDRLPRASPRTGGCHPAVGFAHGGRASGASGAGGENGILSCQECHCEIYFPIFSPHQTHLNAKWSSGTCCAPESCAFYALSHKAASLNRNPLQVCGSLQGGPANTCRYITTFITNS